MSLFVANRIFLLTCVLAAGLAGCGGGGSGSATASAAVTDTTGATSGTTPTSTTKASTLGLTVISGVASTGAPVMGASLRIMDANGAEVVLLDPSTGTAYPAGQSVVKTVVADGSYRVTLASASQALPLLIQVAGIDASGLPLLLHSTLSNGTLPLIANVTPATDAVVAMVLGANPRDIWLNAAASTAALSNLGTASVLTAASDLIKTVIKANLTAAKLTTVDFFKDSSFVANKTGLDMALEGLRFQIVKTNAGLDQLELSNKFVSRAAPEVKIDLAKVKAELIKTTGGLPANAIGSTLKITTNPTIVAANLITVPAVLATLDDFSAYLNQLIAHSAPASTKATFDAIPAMASYVMHNGRTKSQLTDLLVTNTGSNLQFGRFLITGCLDDPLLSTGCTRVAVSTLVSTRDGSIKAVFSDVASYQAGVLAKGAVPAKLPQWLLVGNGAQTQFDVFPATYAQYSQDGSLIAPTAPQTNPLSGVITNLRAQDWSATPVSNIVESKVQSPSNYVVRFSDCAQIYLCINPQPSGVGIAAAAGLGVDDVLINPTTSGWVGGVESIAAAKYIATYALGAATAPVYTQNAYLMADVPLAPVQTQFPALDTAPTLALIQTPGKLLWSKWASANPQMKIKNVRLIAYPAGAGSVAHDFPMPLLGATGLDLALVGVLTVAPTYQLLLTSQDNLGRYFFSSVSIVN